MPRGVPVSSMSDAQRKAMFARMLEEAQGGRPAPMVKKRPLTAQQRKQRRRRIIAAGTVVGLLIGAKLGMRSRNLSRAIQTFEKAAPMVKKSAPLGKYLRQTFRLQKRLARAAGVPTRDLRGVQQYLHYTPEMQRASGFRAGLSLADEAASRRLAELQVLTRGGPGTVTGKILHKLTGTKFGAGGPIKARSMIGLGRLDMNPLTMQWSRMGKGLRRASLKHEIGHNVWMGLSPETRMTLGPQAQRTWASKAFQYPRPGAYAFGQRGSEAFAEIYKTHRRVPWRQFKSQHGKLRQLLARKERRILAKGLWESRRAQGV